MLQFFLSCSHYFLFIYCVAFPSCLFQVAGCPNLLNLNFAFWGAVDPEALRALSQCRVLQRLNLDGCRNLDFSALDTLVLGVPSLCVLSLRLCSLPPAHRALYRCARRNLLLLEDVSDLEVNHSNFVAEIDFEV